jgi:FkbH-like protein
MEKLVASELTPLANVHVVRSPEILSIYPVEDYYDRAGDELGHIPYTPEFFAGLATAIIRRIHGLRMAPFKVLVLDCDNTLWRGICGEDGPEGVEIDPGRRALQQFALAQRESGMLLAICSKNNEEDVLETFRVHPEMLLRLEDFTANRITWEPKAGNLRALAAELEFGHDSFICVDDDPKECAEIEANCPGVLTLTLPPEDEIEHYLHHVWAFDRAKITREDRERAAQYAQRNERRRFEQQAPSLEDFLAGLQLEVRIAPLEPQQLARAAQLIQRTNQMNCTVVRRTEAELQGLLRSGVAECLVVDASDRFGAYGMVAPICGTCGAASQPASTLGCCHHTSGTPVA